MGVARVTTVAKYVLSLETQGSMFLCAVVVKMNKKRNHKYS